MPSLYDFVESWNSNTLLIPNGYCAKPQEYRLRPSSLGEPGYIVAIKRLVQQYGVEKSGGDSHFYGARQDMFQVGHETEARVVAVLRETGYSVDTQVPVEFELAGFTIKGTADLVFNGDTVVDVKTCCASNFKRYQTWVPQTYQTQVRLYCHGLGIKKGALLLYNKDNHELHYTPVVQYDEIEMVHSTLSYLAEMDQLETLEDKLDAVFDKFYITPPKPQVSKGTATGLMLTPHDLYNHKDIRDILWETREESGTTYITGAREFYDTVAKIRETVKS